MTAATAQTPYRVRVRYIECDAAGELFPAACLSYFHEAAAAALRAVDLDLRTLSAPDGPLRQVEASVRLAQTAGYDQVLDVHAWVEGVAADRLVLSFRMCAAGSAQWIAQGRMVFAARQQPSGGAASLSARVQGLLRRLLQPSQDDVGMT